MSSFTAANWARKNYPYLIAIALFIFFKFLFPYPDVFLDSVNYLQWGLTDAQIAYRPLGYSHFLMLFSGYGNNYINVVAFQYLVFVIATKFFLDTIFSIFNPNNKIKWLCWILILLNPINLFINNLISTDGLFISFSAVWLASLLQFLYAGKRKYVYLAIHLISFIFLFGLRYNALYYPAISVLAFLFLKKENFLTKLIPVVLTSAVFLTLYINTCDNSDKQVGVPILSGFGGWAMANNALHVYRVTNVDSSIWDDSDDKELHQFVLRFKDSISGTKTGVTDRFLWDKKSPLKQYLAKDLKLKKYTNYLAGWWGESIQYNTFGKKLIMSYPGAFFKGFYGPNLGYVFYPPTEVLGMYNQYNQHLEPSWQEYFGVHQDQFTTKAPAIQECFVKAFDLFCIPLSIITTLCSLFLAFLFVKTVAKRKSVTPAFATLVILAAFYIISTLLLAFAHPVLLRYILLLHVYFVVVPIFFFANKIFKNLPAEEKTAAA
ncbi:hypothetical protein [Taibaiella soli]|uniref:Glycosyltransferase RgtA/B/C/D-like domain-containing protein n=1 Tax=Taibaiella soli TaxID=1649169 RepID=A0A2W2AZ36_9BACT|nr:hypothetical protein [Taibaiella soli]PZF72928.1 hypothetical protein DN068_10985 [Taibaiella soli]